jgi:hypothetical protein
MEEDELKERNNKCTFMGVERECTDGSSVSLDGDSN